MNRKNDLYPFIFEQSVHTEVVIACFDELSKTLKKKTVVVMDNASVHTSEEFEQCLPQWKKQGLIIKYLTTYSPELNLIEILWVRIPNYFCLSAYSYTASSGTNSSGAMTVRPKLSNTAFTVVTVT